ncbi:hypothetical protein DES38_101131 [Streptohalobacillus salinus]|uniref:Uncharacterized protein n=1 Tax=Streptohalobacillus salinus TaxID=621096 RepID=A0A2V3WDS3_9BACI|nr:hypothetical protein DES38_101131 [Streptohalobacillus salinus]
MERRIQFMIIWIKSATRIVTVSDQLTYKMKQGQQPNLAVVLVSFVVTP